MRYIYIPNDRNIYLIKIKSLIESQKPTELFLLKFTKGFFQFIFIYIKFYN